MEQINEINKLLKQANSLNKKAIESAKQDIAKLPIEEQQKYRALMQKAMKGDLTVEQLMKEVRNGKNS